MLKENKKIKLLFITMFLFIGVLVLVTDFKERPGLQVEDRVSAKGEVRAITDEALEKPDITYEMEYIEKQTRERLAEYSKQRNKTMNKVVEQALEQRRSIPKKKDETEVKSENKKETKIKSTKSKKKPNLTPVNKKYFASNDVNFRNEAGLGSKVINRIKKGEELLVLGKTNKIDDIIWYKVKKGSVEGFVSSYYLKPPTKNNQQETKQSSKPKVEKNKNKQAQEKSKYPPMSITYNGKTVYYKNVGKKDSLGSDGNYYGEAGQAQRTIDTTNYVATYGGSSVFSGTDNQNTHFIGHNAPNQFAGITDAEVFVVTDAEGKAFEYVRTSIYLVDIQGVRTTDKEPMIYRIVGTGGGERITLQTTQVHPIKWIVEAKFNREIK